MSANFFRLHGGIIDAGEENVSQRKSIVRGKKNGTYAFEKERRETLDTLGYNVGLNNEKSISRNKHHGKIARDKTKTITSRKITALSAQQNDLIGWKQEYQFKLQEINIYKSLAIEIKDVINDNKKIPNSLFRKFEKNHGPSVIDKSTSSSASAALLSSTNKKILKPLRELPPSHTPVKIPIQNPNYNTIRREILTASKDKWTQKEKRKINDLYWEISAPKSKNLSAWDVYYQTFVSRLLESFSNHSVNDIKSKIEEMLVLKKIKMPGEEEYWKNQSQCLVGNKGSINHIPINIPLVKKSIRILTPLNTESEIEKMEKIPVAVADTNNSSLDNNYFTNCTTTRILRQIED